MEESFQWWEVIYFASAILGAALSGVSRAIHNGNYESFTHVMATAGVSGLLGFAVVAILGGDHRDAQFNPVFYVGVAVVVGLAGREQTVLITTLWGFIVKGLQAALGVKEEREDN